MESYPRLIKSALIERLRAHERAHGWVSNATLHEHDPVAQRSIPLHFPSMSATRVAAGVAGPPYEKPKNKTGPKPGSPIGRRPPTWTRQRVIEELRRLHRAGSRLVPAELDTALLHAAASYAGGLRAARRLAGISAAPPERSKKWWNEARVLAEIKKRKCAGQPLATTRTPTKLVTAGRWHFGSWAKALAAAGVDAATVRVSRRIYTNA
ncbi:MAG: hypothetical protein ABJE66_03910 [Deltaproteobacteria bacterium]